MNPLSTLRDQFQTQIELREKRPGIQQLFAPLYHEDGDMVDIFLDVPTAADLAPADAVRISDHGLTLMRLSYAFELDSPNKERIFQRILAENGIEERSGSLVIDTQAQSLYPAILQFAQRIAKVCNMRLFKREVLASLFDEMLTDFIQSTLGRFHVRPGIYPLADRDDLEVDWEFSPRGVPIYLFGVKDTAKARLTALSCLEFLRHGLTFKSVAVHEDFEKLTRKDRTRVTSACDKQFTGLDDFKQNAEQYFSREAA